MRRRTFLESVLGAIGAGLWLGLKSRRRRMELADHVCEECPTLIPEGFTFCADCLDRAGVPLSWRFCGLTSEEKVRLMGSEAEIWRSRFLEDPSLWKAVGIDTLQDIGEHSSA